MDRASGLPPLDILIHPNSGCEVRSFALRCTWQGRCVRERRGGAGRFQIEDHMSWALWGGSAWELDDSIFSCEHPSCVPPSSTEL